MGLSGALRCGRSQEKIENILLRSAFVAQAFVHGDSFHSALVAVLVPDFDALGPWAAANHCSGPPEHLCGSAEVRAMVLKDITAIGRANKLVGFELPKQIFLDWNAFSPENGLLTVGRPPV